MIGLLVPLAAGIALAIRLVPAAPAGLPPTETIHFVQEAPPGHLMASGAVVSPDGRHLAFVARQRDTGRVQLWVRSLNAQQARLLPGTEGAFRPFWAPGSRAIGFFADGKLKRVGLDNQPPQTLADVGYRPSGGSWSRSGVILFSDRQSRLYAVSETGGEKTADHQLSQSVVKSRIRRPSSFPTGDTSSISRSTRRRRPAARISGRSTHPSGSACSMRRARPRHLPNPGICSTCVTAASWRTASIPNVGASTALRNRLRPRAPRP